MWYLLLIMYFIIDNDLLKKSKALKYIYRICIILRTEHVTNQQEP